MARVTQAEEVDNETGEVVTMTDPGAFALQLAKAGGLSLKDLEKRVAAAEKATDKDLEEKEMDWWDPKTAFLAEKKPQELRGVYLGSATKGKRVEHALGVRSTRKAGKFIAVRFNGSAQLTSDLAQVEVGTPVVITYLGKVPMVATMPDGTQQTTERHNWNLKLVKGD